MNSISLNQTVTSTIDGVRTVVNSNVVQNTSSSNFIVGGQDVGSAAWVALSVGSLTDVIGITVKNDDSVYSSSIVTVATGSAGQNVIGYVYPGGQMTTMWSGSVASLYAKVTGGVKVATPTSASVMWLVQQS